MYGVWLVYVVYAGRGNYSFLKISLLILLSSLLPDVDDDDLVVVR